MKFSKNMIDDVVASVFAVVLLSIISLTTSAQDLTPRLQPAECFLQQGDWVRDVKLECKWLVVQEARGNPKSRVIKLAVVVLKARQLDGSPPVVMLHGGPGQSGIQAYTRVVTAAQLNERRDFVIYDQRGSGFSQPRLCLEQREVAQRSERLKTQAEQEKFWEIADRKCIASLDSQGVVRSAYNTRTSAEDLIDLRKLLGYASWNIYGVSYGARLAQEVMQRDPNAIRSALLSSPVTHSPAFQSELPLSAQRAFERVFADCRDQADCRTTFPHLEKDFYAVYDDLMKSPLSVNLAESSGMEPIILDGKRFISSLRAVVLPRPGRLAGLPILINEFRRGDKMRAAKTLVGYDPQNVIGGNQVIANLVNCYDVYGKQLREERKRINARVQPPFREKKSLEECKYWQTKYADPSEHALVRSDIPTLILTGRYDDRTPTEHGKLITSKLSKAWLYEFPNEGHGAGTRPSTCTFSIMKQFWENPYAEPDATCISKIPAIRFVTSWDRMPQRNVP